MPLVRLATFNVENLFARFKFNKTIKDSSEMLKNGWTVNDTLFEIYDETTKKITADAINSLKADILALQEIENHDTLRRFRNEYLGGKKIYPYTMLIDGNDPRRIDVAIMSKYPIKNVDSYIHLLSDNKKSALFSRDCLKAEIIIDSKKTLTLFVNHFKSMLDKSHPNEGRKYTKNKRIEQTEMVKKIVSDHFSLNVDKSAFAILGDFNDYIEKGKNADSGITALVNWNKLFNVIELLPESERWTHYYKKSKTPEYRQLDYILVSKPLTEKIKFVGVERRGLPKKADTGSDKRFKNVGNNNPKASDHAPLYCDIEF